MTPPKKQQQEYIITKAIDPYDIHLFYPHINFTNPRGWQGFSRPPYVKVGRHAPLQVYCKPSPAMDTRMSEPLRTCNKNRQTKINQLGQLFKVIIIKCQRYGVFFGVGFPHPIRRSPLASRKKNSLQPCCLLKFHGNPCETRQVLEFCPTYLSFQWCKAHLGGTEFLKSWWMGQQPKPWLFSLYRG